MQTIKKPRKRGGAKEKNVAQNQKSPTLCPADIEDAPVDIEDVLGQDPPAACVDEVSKQASCERLFQNWKDFGLSTSLNFISDTLRTFELTSSLKPTSSRKPFARHFHVHELEKGAGRSMKPVFIIQGRVTESAFDDDTVLAKLDYNDLPFQIHQYSVTVKDQTGGKGLNTS